MRRLVKEQLLTFEGKPLFPERIAYTVPYKLSQLEAELYKHVTVCERKGWAEEAIAYNSLVVAWPEISRLASQASTAPADGQMTLK